MYNHGYFKIIILLKNEFSMESEGRIYFMYNTCSYNSLFHSFLNIANNDEQFKTQLKESDSKIGRLICNWTSNGNI
jgi:hypothetical protein